MGKSKGVLFNKPYLNNSLLGYSLILTGLGLLFIYSSEVGKNTHHILFFKQLFGVLIAFITYIMISRIEYRRYANLPIFTYIVGIILLVIVFFFGKTVNGSKSWVSLGLFHAQLSEFAKLAYIVVLAGFINRFQDNVSSISFFFLAALVLVPYLGLLFIQPDFGTSIVFMFIFVVVVFLAGGNISALGFLLPIGIIAIAFPFLGYYLHLSHSGASIAQLFWKPFNYVILCISSLCVFLTLLVCNKILRKRSLFILTILAGIVFLGFLGALFIKYALKEYHYKRILILFNPDLDPMGKGYNINQSLISIGSGKLFGLGLTHGVQNNGNFLPAESTDFILALIGEEWGFVGVTLVVLLNILLIHKIFQMASESTDFIGFLIVVGIGALFIGHFLINIFSVIGILPIIGIPLPFLSYGGSSLVTNYIALGILCNIKNSRYY